MVTERPLAYRGRPATQGEIYSAWGSAREAFDSVF